MNAKIARQVVNYFQRGQTVKSLLNDKEWAIANGIKDGLSYKMIADREELSLDGVRFYIQRIYRKLNINSRGELAKMMS
jgi:DNA-binding NarL/FixJ family response regulator